MSTIKITSLVEKVLEGTVGSGTVIKNNFASKTEGVAADFVADYCTIDSWVLNSVQGAAFAENILRVIDTTVAGTNVSFIHIQCTKRVITSTDQPDPIRFAVSLDATAIGTTSQFQLGNCNIAAAAITISAVAVPAGAEAIVTVIVGFNK